MKDKSPAITILRWIGKLLPGDYLKTAFYLNVVARPRKIMRLALNGFYRMEHVYDVLRDAKQHYTGRFSILEFGTNEGYALAKMLYATRYLKMEDRVTVHGFDTFEGMPSPRDARDRNLVFNRDEWVEGQFKGEYERLDALLSARYSNYRLHRGLFDEALTEEVLAVFQSELPILVWIDCDFYSSARSAMERIMPYLPNGCFVYFDEYEFNFGSRLTGESRLVHEINHGAFGEDLELVLDRNLSMDSRRIYRFMRLDNPVRYEPARPHELDSGRSPTNHSPLP